jgi:type IV secretion system protein VirB6
MAILCATPPPDIGMVQGLLTSVDCNVRGLTEAGYGALATGNSPMAAILTLMLTLYIAFIGYGLLIGRTPLRVGDVTISALKIGGILALATSWPTYQQLVFETLFHGPEQFAAGMMGSIEPSGSDQIGPFAGLQARRRSSPSIASARPRRCRAAMLERRWLSTPRPCSCC